MVACCKGSKTSQTLFSTSSHSDEQCISSRESDNAVDACQMIQSVLEKYNVHFFVNVVVLFQHFVQFCGNLIEVVQVFIQTWVFCFWVRRVTQHEISEQERIRHNSFSLFWEELAHNGRDEIATYIFAVNEITESVSEYSNTLISPKSKETLSIFELINCS